MLISTGEGSHSLPSEAAALEIFSQRIKNRLRQPIHSFKEDSQQLLRTSNSFRVVRRLCKYGLLDLEDCVMLLSQRSESDLDILWARLAEPHDKSSLPQDDNGDSLTRDKAKKILWKINSNPPPPSLPLWDRSWTLSLFATSRTADQVAHDLVQQTNSVLSLVPFPEYQRHFCGFGSVFIDDVLCYISAVRREFCNHLHTSDAAKHLIEDINVNASLKHSLARWAVASSLSDPDSNLDPSVALLPMQDAIQEVFLNTKLSRKLQLKNMELLDRLYQAVARGQGGWQYSFGFPTQALLALKSKENLANEIQEIYFTNSGQNKDEGTASHSVYSSSTLDIVRRRPSSDWLSLLESRANEARDFLETACHRDKDLITRYLPSLCRGSVNTPPQPAAELRWVPPKNLNREHTAGIIASRVFEEIHAITFAEFVRAGCGFRSERIENLYTLAKGIYKWYRSSIQLQEEYSGLESVLAQQYPLVYNLISTAPDPRGFDSIFATVQDLIARDDLSITNIFRRFAVLSVRYEDARGLEKCEAWDGRLSSEFTFLDEISSATPVDVVTTMIERHSALFAALREEDYPRSDRIRFISDTWDRLSKSTRECALADGGLVSKLAGIETEFFRFRDFFGGSAIHLALAGAGIHPKKTQIFNGIVDSKNDFRYYWQCWQRAPGLPFLMPHIHGRSGERYRQEFFRVRGYANWRSKGNEEHLTIYLYRDTGYLPVLLMTLLSQLRQVLPCFPFSGKNRNQSHQDLEKGLPTNSSERATHTLGGDGAGLLPATSTGPTSGDAAYESHSGFEAKFNCSHSRKRTGVPQVTSMRAASYLRRPWQAATAIPIPRLRLAYLWHLITSLCLCSMLSNKSRSGLDETTRLLDTMCAERATNRCRTDAYTSLTQQPVMNSADCENISMLGGGSHMVASSRDSSIFGSSIGRCVVCMTELMPLPPGYIVLAGMQGSPAMRRALARIRQPELDQTWMAVASSIKAANLDKPTEIIRYLDQDLPALPIMDHEWSPPHPECNKTSRAIAAIMDETLYFPFRLIPFAVLRDAAAYGNYTDLFTDLLRGITHVYNELCRLFIKYPKLRGLYEEAKTMMQFPVSITVVSNSLMNLSKVPPPIDALHFIFDPIKTCQDPLLTYASELKYLAALEITWGKMLEGRHGSRWWGLSEVSLDVEHVSPIALGREIMRTRKMFSETSSDIIKTFRSWGPGEAAATLLQVKRNNAIAAAERAVRLYRKDAGKDIPGEV